MANWTEPVYDRTQADVDYARSQIMAQNNDVEFKGCFNVTDILRIDNNTRHLADLLNELYYFNAIVTSDSWGMLNVPNKEYVDRFISNVATMWEKYEKPNGSVELPTTLLTYEQVNSIEKNIYLLKVLLTDMISSFRECNTFECGEA